MTNHGNVQEMGVGQFAELVTAVVRCLPRDLSPQEAQRWVNDSHALTLALRQALHKASAFTLQIDYGQTMEEALKAGNYDWVNDNLTSEHFPPTRRGTETVELHLVHFGRRMTDKEITRELNNRGLRDGCIEELLALGEAHPDLQRQFPIVARGSVWTRPYGDRGVPGLWGFDRGRSADLGWLGRGWFAGCRFLAVRK